MGKKLRPPEAIAKALARIKLSLQLKRQKCPPGRQCQMPSFSARSAHLASNAKCQTAVMLCGDDVSENVRERWICEPCRRYGRAYKKLRAPETIAKALTMRVWNCFDLIYDSQPGSWLVQQDPATAVARF
ncbi:hypothetical protein N7509_004196 [Penicillium cosmopolitanum]|uniref:Uncharacterized protein n=1 Tax=Penicillium cosmopolitanum TaxID=1131564 RepID=A0A9W9W6G2_9EURO|nr:uncharacterized protein N7509_004196 [Penicillium cosmopolitanum]KAJ5404325.1 hypothetical protein N7509_004196 [Penicillium cosmopolitanum]